MTVLSSRPQPSHSQLSYSHGGLRTHVGDPEPPLSELLADPVLHLVMAGDGVSRAALDAAIAAARRRLLADEPSLYAALEAKLLLECA